MGKRPKRKIVLLLVEGKSDREALQLAIPEFYDQIDENIEVFFPIIREDEKETGGDVTSKIGVHPRNLEATIYNLFLRDFFDEEKIMPKDITEIIQIVDVDGVYIPDAAVVEGINPTGTNRPYYSEETIICSNVAHITKRNECKRENLDYLSSLTTIKVKQKTVPYSIYYFSSNLDHFLHHDANIPYQVKCALADTFAKNYIGDPEGFVEEISGDPGAVKGMSFVESWNYIREGLNSLQRHTNLNLLFEKLIAEGAE